MRLLNLIVTALVAAPSAIALEFPKELDHRDYQPTRKRDPLSDTVLKSGIYPYKPKAWLTPEFVCEKLTEFADEAEFIQTLVDKLESNADLDVECFEPLRKALYEFEFRLDLFDTAIDVTKIGITDKARDACEVEARITCCYRNYADRMIAALNAVSDLVPHSRTASARSIIIAINSLRAADYTFVYELVRRMSCDEQQLRIFERQGAMDGSTPNSIREAFARFITVPEITGEYFEVQPGEKPHTLPDLPEPKIIEKIECPNKFDHQKNKCDKCREKCKKVREKCWKKTDNKDDFEKPKGGNWRGPGNKNNKDGIA